MSDAPDNHCACGEHAIEYVCTCCHEPMCIDCVRGALCRGCDEDETD